MCGIFGITINKNSVLSHAHFKEIHRELFLLSESRGKEASGFAFLNGEKIVVYKTPLPSSELIRLDVYNNSLNYPAENNKYAAAIGHSRLVTNGLEQCNENNQPVIKSKMVGIHNGIVTNVNELWNKYKDEKKESQLDSELIFTLLRRFYEARKSLKSAVYSTFSEIYGMASIAVLFQDFGNLLLATNNGSIYYIKGGDSNSFVFASEYYILKKLLSKKNFKRYFDPYKICQLKPRTSCLVNFETTGVEYFDFSHGSDGNDFKNISCYPNIFNIKKLSDKNVESLSDLEEILNREISFYVPKEFIEHFSKNQQKIHSLKKCTRCILPETFPFIQFDEAGVCNYCNHYKKLGFKGEKNLVAALEPFRRQDNYPDCIVAFSGGRDSSYSLHFIKSELKLNPIAYSYDWGMITDLARRNQARLCGKLGIEHILISADIRKKRANIRQNVLAWLKRPSLGTIPLFMAGDKQYFYYANQLMKQNNIKLVILGENMLETTNFKSGFCGIRPGFDKDHTYSLSVFNKLKMVYFYVKEYLMNPAFLNSSIMDTLWAFFSYYLIPHNYLNLYEYIKWDEKIIESTLINEYDWETDPGTRNTWRIGDGTASFYNYIYYIVTGFTENDTFRSNQVREGMISRNQALKIVNDENQPRWEAIKWYCDTIHIDFEETIRSINSIKKIYQI